MSPVYGTVHVVQSSMRNWDGNHYLAFVGVGARILQIHKNVSDKSPQLLQLRSKCQGKVIIEPFMS